LNPQIKILDDWLPLAQFEPLADFLSSNEFPWYFNDTINGWDQETPSNPLTNFQFTHMFIRDAVPVSHYLSEIMPLIVTLEAIAVLRCKANLNPVCAAQSDAGMHVDYTSPMTTAIFYLNSNNGGTAFEDGSFTQSKANRLVIFPSNVLHSSRGCTDAKRRLVLNFNYITEANLRG
jgi:hypothetical protein